MLSLYIVDDEPMAIQYLEMLLKATGCEYEITGTQTNSTKACYEILEKKPDVVFTDISMPVMDGLTLAEKVLKNYSPLVYLLTSYEDFEFAKKGVRIGVKDYLLKNELSEEMLKKLLEEAEQSLQTERRQRHLILERNIRDFLLSRTTDTEDYIYHEKALQRYALLLFYKPPRLWFNPSEAPVEENLSLDSYALQNMQHPEGLQCTGFAQTRSREYCAIVFIGQTVVDGRRRIYQMADRILSEISLTQDGWRCIFSDVRTRFFELQEEYQKAASLTGWLYALRDQTIFGVHDLRPETQALPHEEYLDELYQDFAQGKREEAVQHMTRFFDFCREHDSQQMYLENMRSLYQILRRCTLQDGRGLENLDMAPCYAATTNLERALMNCAELYFQEREERSAGRYSDHVADAMAFIRRHYMEDISVADIAGAASLSEGHLRRLFKQELNTSVIDYLTEYRIEKAKVLLQQRSRPASQIWQETGFSSAQYFSYVFRKKEGKTPKEYQNERTDE